jgi:hypothetical protein
VSSLRDVIEMQRREAERLESSLYDLDAAARLGARLAATIPEGVLADLKKLAPLLPKQVAERTGLDGEALAAVLKVMRADQAAVLEMVESRLLDFVERTKKATTVNEARAGTLREQIATLEKVDAGEPFAEVAPLHEDAPAALTQGDPQPDPAETQGAPEAHDDARIA